MKEIFEGEIFEECPESWAQRIEKHSWLRENVLKASKYRDIPFRFVVHKNMCVVNTQKHQSVYLWKAEF